MLLRVFAIFLLVVFAVTFAALMFSSKGRRSFGLALRSLWLHKLRSFLSVLGIIIGTAAVIALMGFGEGSMQDALEDIKRQGATNIIVRSVKPPDDSSQQRQRMAVYGLTWADYERFGTIPSVVRRVPMRIFSQETRYYDRSYTARMVATIPEYQDVNQLEMAAGRFLTADDDHHMMNICVLGSVVADKLFPFEDALGKSIKLGNSGGSFYYRVVGVIKERMPTGGTGGSQAAEDYNSDVYIPFQTCNARYGPRIFIRKPGSFTMEEVELSQVTLTIEDMPSVRPAGDVVRSLLEDLQLHPRKEDWAITVPLDKLEAAERERDRFTRLLAIIALISLGVGGIGIMNIMLATVTERIREIGIRRALGAKRRDIVLQFLIEAIVQTSLGGAVGVIFGLTVVFTWPKIVWLLWRIGWIDSANQPAVVNYDSLLLSVVVAIVVGLAFGLYPAWKASRLDPIEALRHE
jgi:putative ABC transport system permease protein